MPTLVPWSCTLGPATAKVPSLITYIPGESVTFALPITFNPPQNVPGKSVTVPVFIKVGCVVQLPMGGGTFATRGSGVGGQSVTGVGTYPTPDTPPELHANPDVKADAPERLMPLLDVEFESTEQPGAVMVPPVI